MLFEMVKNNEIICVYSDLCELELENAPTQVKEHFLSLNNSQTEFAEITEEINNLAEQYVLEQVVGKTSIDDCRHIACATINKVIPLVSLAIFSFTSLKNLTVSNSFSFLMSLFICYYFFR